MSALGCNERRETFLIIDIEDSPEPGWLAAHAARFLDRPHAAWRPIMRLRRKRLSNLGKLRISNLCSLSGPSGFPIPVSGRCNLIAASVTEGHGTTCCAKGKIQLIDGTNSQNLLFEVLSLLQNAPSVVWRNDQSALEPAIHFGRCEEGRAYRKASKT
jgi:hypothetical protein